MRILLLLLLLPVCCATAGEKGFSGLTFVRDDASLSVSGRRVHLYGIYIPDAGEDCDVFQRPLVCGTHARLALEFKIRGFVHCTPRQYNEDRSITAQCRVNRSAFSEGEDLSAYLIRKGWALTRPDAPFEYQALEKIARHRGAGLWGIPGRF
jgi:endonuclease YncB( thermonuclease family)